LITSSESRALIEINIEILNNIDIALSFKVHFFDIENIKSKSLSMSAWRTLAYQEVRLRIGPLAKLGRFKSTVDNFLVYIVTISLASGLIQSLTSWYAKVLHDSVKVRKLGT